MTSTDIPLEPAARWVLPADPPAALASDLPELDPVLASALGARGIRDAAAARLFLAHDPGVDDPRLIAGMAEAVARLLQAIESGESIVVYGDFDADGVTATAVLVETLTKLGARVEPFIPHRVRDGYGIQSESLTRLATKGTDLVVTVDCGIRAASEIAAASEAGLDVIVTDHHVLPDQLPRAVAVINPKRPDCAYPSADLAGVGLAYKLAVALLEDAPSDARSAAGLAGGVELLDLVAIGTVADMVPLVGENRSLVQRGLEVLRRTKRPGIRALAKVAQLDLAEARARDIGFGLAPRLNAAGRMDDADAALELLLAPDDAAALPLARELEARNSDRREATERAIASAEQELAGKPDDPFLWFTHPELELGIAGLVASRLVDRYRRPAAAVRTDSETARGSARSIPQFDVVGALAEASDILVRFGGHARAAGFTVLTTDLPELQQRMVAAAAAQLAGRDLRPTLEIDAELAVSRLNRELYTQLQRLAPFGEANRRPLLLARNVPVTNVRVVGTNHLKFTVEAGLGMGSLEAIAFGQGERCPSLEALRRADLVFRFIENVWRGRRQLELHVVDLAAPGADSTREAGAA